MNIYKHLRFILVLLICGSVLPAWPASEEVILASPFNEAERLSGFYNQQKKNDEFERIRLSGLDEVKRQRETWDQMLAATLPEYKKEKSKQAAPLDETSREYKEDLKARDDEDLQAENRRLAYVKLREEANRKRNVTVKLTEEEEYALVPDPERVDWRKRSLYAGKGKFAPTSGGGGSASSPPSNDFDAAPPPPPPPPPPQDFYEPDIPPPPPMEGNFEDNLPPPIFDDPEF